VNLADTIKTNAAAQAATRELKALAAVGGLVILLAQIVGLALLPIVLYWAVTTLAGVAVPLTFKTWLAALILLVAVRWRRSRK
jgi:hypothetical protein